MSQYEGLMSYILIKDQTLVEFANLLIKYKIE